MSRLDWWPASKMETVSNRHFINERVVLDNHAFYDCVFENVTVTYGGGESMAFGSKFIGRNSFEITSVAGTRIVNTMMSLGVLQKQPQAVIEIKPAT
jgi:hypothetical protein